MPASLLLVDDDVQIARHVGHALASGFDVASVETVGAALQHLATHAVDCVILDYRLPDCHGLGGLRAILGQRPDVPVVMVTGAGSEEVAVQAMKLGAIDYVVKHGCWIDAMAGVVREALGRRTMRQAVAAAGPPNGQLPRATRERYRDAGILGESAAIQAAVALADRATRADATILLEGETGTGKELFARAIHRQGRRARGPFVAVNCAALPEPLLESELFGHLRGAFSGADRDRQGLFEAAAGGTLLLDEVSELTPGVQAKLLRVLQEREVRPVGASRNRPVDVRVIAAANTDLRGAVEAGRFRLDLYHRLHVFPIVVPPLRHRTGDIELLARHFLRHFAAPEGKAPLTYEPEVLAVLAGYRWPGNVRELENEVHRLVLCAEPKGRIGIAMLPAHLRAASQGGPRRGRSLKDILRDVELATVSRCLRENGYRRSATARSLGLSREGLWQKLRQLGLRPPARDGEG